jgi:dolichol-phosphate mannosyltransferase
VSGPSISVAVPVYNETEALPELYERLRRTLDALTGDWELVVADDGSTDGTRTILRDLAARDPRVRAVMLSRNFGHTPAYLAALDHTRGEWTVLMDGDLQDEPEMIPRMLQAAREGFEVVYAIKTKRKEGPLMRAAFSLYYRVAARVSTVPQPAHAGPFCLMSRRVVEEIRRLPEQNVFFPGVRSYVGFRQTGINVDRPARTNGTSRIRIGRRVAGALDGIFAFSNVPLRLAAWMGFLVAALAGALGLMFVYYRIFTDVPVRGFTALMTVLLFLGGVQLLSLGIIGEYLGRIYNEVKGRPRYHVEERLNIGAEPPRDQAPSVQRSEESPNGR